MSHQPRHVVADLLGRLGGAALGGLFGVTAQVRGTRALHPVGVCGTGIVRVRTGPRSGAVLLDDPGPHPCQVRWSRATGRRHGRDVEGLALRLQGRAVGDVLLASTGTGVVGRHLLVVRPVHRHGTLTTLLPLRTERGPLLLRLDPVGEEHPPAAYRLLVSAPGHPWHERGRLDVRWTQQDCLRRHAPVRHPPAGTWTHPFWARLRQPAYDSSQRVDPDLREPPQVPFSV